MNPINKRYASGNVERTWQENWEKTGVYHFQNIDGKPVYSIDTPPPTVSGDLHLGHCYSYSQADFYARFWRMNGSNVFYPMGWDDNGLPTERLVEERMGIRPESAGIEAFLKAITQTSKQLEDNYRQLWQRLGLSVDWRHIYSTIDPYSRKVAQYSFIDLYKKNLVYRAAAPTAWCPHCKTAIAQAEVADLQRETSFITIAFKLSDGQILPIATTRPELLPACVAVFVHPDDKRHRHIIGKKALIPLFQKEVPILADIKAEPEKGTGIVMCCTFGDTTDIKWWREHRLPLINVIERDGRLNPSAGFLAGLDIKSARKKVIEELNAGGLVLDKKATSQTVSMHERCDTPIEYIETQQWFIKILDRKESLIDAGNKINWHPQHFHARYEDWVKNLEWDWCVSRQRYHGVPFPLWYCTKCNKILIAKVSELPIDPRTTRPSEPCVCGSREFVPETSIMDTWATSSLTPQIAGKWLDGKEFFHSVFPMSVRPQAHDIIRTWAFYTIVKSLYHFQKLPWSHVAISGHGLSPEGHKVSKSKSHEITDPMEMMDKYSADAVRFWAAGSKFGEDTLINEDRIASGQKFVNKLWNVTNFSYPFLEGYRPPPAPPPLLPTDRWALSRLQRLVSQTTTAFQNYNHVLARNNIETYFWETLTNNYLEMVKTRLYDSPDGSPERESAKYALYNILLTVVAVLAPVLPYVTEEIYQLVFKRNVGAESVHVMSWPKAKEELIDTAAETAGATLIEIASAVRRDKAQREVPTGSALERIKIAVPKSVSIDDIRECIVDIKSVTRAKIVDISEMTSTTSEADTSIPSVEITV